MPGLRELEEDILLIITEKMTSHGVLGCIQIFNKTRFNGQSYFEVTVENIINITFAHINTSESAFKLLKLLRIPSGKNIVT